MNIALVVPGGVDRSGKERVVPALLWLIERLARRHRVLVIALHQEPEPSCYDLLGARVINLGMRPRGLSLRLAWRLISVLRAEAHRPQVLHALWAGSTGPAATLAGRLLRIPTILALGGGELVWLPRIRYGGLRSAPQRARLRLTLRLASQVTVGSLCMRDLLPDWGRPAHWLPLGVDTAVFVAPPERPPGPPWRLLHVASINPVKDPYTLLEAIRSAAAEEPGIHLDWVGEDTLEGTVERLAHDSGMARWITFHGFQSTEQVSALARRAHIYVQSSMHEGQGVAVLEAAAAGVPTVGTAVGLVAELAPDAAVAVPAGDAAALAAGILDLLRNPSRRATLGAAAQLWARTYDVDWTAEQYERLYAQLGS